jgi:hypothetical protein
VPRTHTEAWFQWVGLPPATARLVVAPACWAVPSVGGDVEACTGDRGSTRLDRAVLTALESGRAVASGWYRSPVEPMDGSALLTPDWSI